MRSDRHLYDPERGREEKIKKKKRRESRKGKDRENRITDVRHASYSRDEIILLYIYMLPSKAL